MRKHISAIIASALVLSVTHTVIAQHSHPEHPTEQEHPPSVAAATYGAASEQEKKQKYTCQMHPEVITDHPGNCPKCGMKLVPVKEKKRRTPINREQAPNSDKSRAGAQHSTSNSDHLMHDGAEIAHVASSSRRHMRTLR